MNISMVVMKLDGTFIYGDYQRQIIEFFNENGIIYGFITERSFRECRYPANVMALYNPDFLVTEQGLNLYFRGQEGEYYRDEAYTPSEGYVKTDLDYLAGYFRCPHNRIVVSGDREKDHSLINPPHLGIVVANCYKGLLNRVKKTEKVYFANEAGSRGVYEGLIWLENNLDIALEAVN